MKYHLTEHARDALAKRRIAPEWVEMALDAPARVEPDRVDAQLEHRLARIEAFGGRYLRVVVNPHGPLVRVVTAYFDRRSTRQ